MFLEIAIGVKAIVIIVALIGAVLGLFPELPTPAPRNKTVIEQAPVIDNHWSALVYAPDNDAREDIKDVHKAEQATIQQADNNAARVAMYAAYTSRASGTLENANTVLIWGIVGLIALFFPLPKRRKEVITT